MCAILLQLSHYTMLIITSLVKNPLISGNIALLQARDVEFSCLPEYIYLKSLILDKFSNNISPNKLKHDGVSPNFLCNLTNCTLCDIPKVQSGQF